MSGGKACTCPQRLAAIFRLNHWFVLARNCNHSAFNGYHWTPSDYSLIGCIKCRNEWRTRSGYVYNLEGATFEQFDAKKKALDGKIWADDPPRDGEDPPIVIQEKSAHD